MADDRAGGNGSDNGSEREALLDLQARLVADAGRLALQAMGALARRQADALDRMLAELETLNGAARGGGHAAPLAVPELYLRFLAQALAAQTTATLDGAAAVNAAAVEWLERGRRPWPLPGEEPR